MNLATMLMNELVEVARIHKIERATNPTQYDFFDGLGLLDAKCRKVLILSAFNERPPPSIQQELDRLNLGYMS